jgi:D-3-phosphoglycerate dehydrogenase
MIPHRTTPRAMKIAILDDYQDAVRKLNCFNLLAGHEVKVFNNTVKGIGQLSVRLRDTEGLVLIRERTAITQQLIEKLPNLRLIVQTGKLGMHVDVEACTKRGIAVAEGTSDAVAAAEFTWALLMAAMRRIPQYATALKHGAWQQSGLKSNSMPANFGLGRRLAGSTLGVWGFGRIGQRVAQFGRAFGMRVLVWGREGSLERARSASFEVAASREALFSDSDVICLHLRLNDETRGIVSAADLQRMKPDALLVNTARAELVAADALVGALNRGRPGFAAVDVFESEPILQGHPLLRLENALCTPHLGYVELTHYEHYFSEAFAHVAAFAAGQPTGLANPEALTVRRR